MVVQQRPLLFRGFELIKQSVHECGGHLIACRAFAAFQRCFIDKFKNCRVTEPITQRFKRHCLCPGAFRADAVIQTHTVTQALKFAANLPRHVSRKTGFCRIKGFERPVHTNRGGLLSILSHIAKPILPNQPGDPRR